MSTMNRSGHHQCKQNKANEGRRRRIQSQAWLAAGALTLGGAVALAAGAGTAQADAGAGGSASDGARASSSPAASPGRDSVQRSHGVAVSAAGAPAQDQPGRSVTAARRSSQAVAATGPAPCQQSNTCGTAEFSFTGGSQTWTVPAGVQSAYLRLQGGWGGESAIAQTPNSGVAVPIAATLQLTGAPLPAPVTELQIVVGGGGQYSNPGSGAGGFNGGGSGGSGSLTGQTGAGGGGATTVYVIAGSTRVPTPVLVAGGGGGGGGVRNVVGGTGGSSGQGVPSGGVFSAGSGSPATGDNAGAGGAGGTQPGGIGTAGGNAEDFSGNAGGGGGGGGWYGGSGGQPGQAGVSPFATAGAGGGGGGGSSYADPALTTLIGVYGDPLADFNGAAQVYWVDILTTALRPLRSGRATDQQLTAIYGDYYPVTWQVTAGALPEGLALSTTGELTGTPKRSGSYSFQATVATEPLPTEQAVSVITYSGTVCSQRCGRGGRT